MDTTKREIETPPRPLPVHLTLRLDENLVAELKRVARENDRSVSAEARRAFRDYLRDYAA